MVDFGYIAIAGNSRKFGYYLTEKGLALFNKDLATDLQQALSNSIKNKELKIV